MNKLSIKWLLVIIVIALLLTIVDFAMMIYSVYSIATGDNLSFIAGIYICGFLGIFLVFADIVLIRAYKTIPLCRCKCGYNYKYPKNVIVTPVAAFLNRSRYGSYVTRIIRFECYCETCGSRRIFERIFNARTLVPMFDQCDISKEIEPSIWRAISRMFRVDDYFKVEVNDGEIEYNKVYTDKDV